MRVGNQRKVQKLSHHRQLNILMIYNDNRGSYQQEVTALLDDKVFEGAIAMTQASVKSLTFEEYLIYDDGTDNRYELVNGELAMVPLPTADHSDAIDLLSDAFRAEIRRLEHPWIVKRDVGVYTRTNPVTGKEHSRTPDVCVMTSSQWQELKADKKSSAVLRTPPLLAVEIVSPGSKKTDYGSKEEEYKAIRILEYWIVDLRNAKVSVLLLEASGYKTTEFKGNERIISQVFPELTLTSKQILSA